MSVASILTGNAVGGVAHAIQTSLGVSEVPSGQNGIVLRSDADDFQDNGRAGIALDISGSGVVAQVDLVSDVRTIAAGDTSWGRLDWNADISGSLQRAGWCGFDSSFPQFGIFAKSATTNASGTNGLEAHLGLVNTQVVNGVEVPANTRLWEFRLPPWNTGNEALILSSFRNDGVPGTFMSPLAITPVVPAPSPLRPCEIVLTGDVTITGNLDVSGSTSIVNLPTVSIAQDTYTQATSGACVGGFTVTVPEDGVYQVLYGIQLNAVSGWTQGTQAIQYSLHDTTTGFISGSAVLLSSAIVDGGGYNQYALTPQVALTAGQVVRSNILNLGAGVNTYNGEIVVKLTRLYD